MGGVHETAGMTLQSREACTNTLDLSWEPGLHTCITHEPERNLNLIMVEG